MGGSMSGFVRVSGMNQNDIRKAIDDFIVSMGPVSRSIKALRNENPSPVYYPGPTSSEATTAPTIVSYCHYDANDSNSEASSNISAKAAGSSTWKSLGDPSFEHLAKMQGDGSFGNMGHGWGTVKLPAGYTIRLTVSASIREGATIVPSAAAHIFVYTLDGQGIPDTSNSSSGNTIDNPGGNTSSEINTADLVTGEEFKYVESGITQARAETVAADIGNISVVTAAQGVATFTYITRNEEPSAVVARAQLKGYSTFSTNSINN